MKVSTRGVGLCDDSRASFGGPGGRPFLSKFRPAMARNCRKKCLGPRSRPSTPSSQGKRACACACRKRAAPRTTTWRRAARPKQQTTKKSAARSGAHVETHNICSSQKTSSDRSHLNPSPPAPRTAYSTLALASQKKKRRKKKPIRFEADGLAQKQKQNKRRRRKEPLDGGLLTCRAAYWSRLPCFCTCFTLGVVVVVVVIVVVVVVVNPNHYLGQRVSMPIHTVIAHLTSTVVAIMVARTWPKVVANAQTS